MENQTRVNNVGIILALIGVALFIALITVPHSGPCGGRRAKESTLRGNLTQMRNAIASFHDDTGKYPLSLTDVVVENESMLTTRVKHGTYKGPYLTTTGGIGGHGVPKNPFTDIHNTRIVDHWKYDAKTGKVTVPDAQVDMKTADDYTPFKDL